MRRGLISWSQEEVPEAVLNRRVGKLQDAMRAENLDAVLAYTSTVQPSAVCWLTHFVPYSNDGLLLVLQEGTPAFFTSFSKRVQGWIREVSRVGELRLGPQLGPNALAFMQESLQLRGRPPRIGLIDGDYFPWAVVEPFLHAGWRDHLIEIGDLFASIRQPADEAELSLTRRAAGMASRALGRVPDNAQRASEVLAAVEEAARCDGAEEVFLRIAPDLQNSPVMVRMEGDAALGARYAVQASLAYKGVWTRAARCLARSGMPAGWKDAERWFAQKVEHLSPDNPVMDVQDAPGQVVRWTIESCLGSQPFTIVSSGGSRSEAAASSARKLPAGTLGFASATLDFPEGAWHGSVAFVLAKGLLQGN